MRAYIESEGPPGNGADKYQDMNEGGYEEGSGAGAGSPAPLKAELISLPTVSSDFKDGEYVGHEIAAQRLVLRPRLRGGRLRGQ